MDYYSFTDPGGMRGWVGLVGRSIADSLPTRRSLVKHTRHGQSAGHRPTSDHVHRSEF